MTYVVWREKMERFGKFIKHVDRNSKTIYTKYVIYNEKSNID